jgi:hypothetical protein
MAFFADPFLRSNDPIADRVSSPSTGGGRRHVTSATDRDSYHLIDRADLSLVMITSNDFLTLGTVRKGAINSHLRLVVPTTVLETDVTPRRKTNIELRPREYLTEDEIERPRKATGAMRVANRETHADCGAQVRSVEHDALCLVFRIRTMT